MSSLPLTRVRFIEAMAERFVARSDMRTNDAESYAENVLDSFLEDGNIAFGDPNFDWSEDGAYTLADEDIYYWTENDDGIERGQLSRAIDA